MIKLAIYLVRAEGTQLDSQVALHAAKRAKIGGLRNSKDGCYGLHIG